MVSFALQRHKVGCEEKVVINHCILNGGLYEYKFFDNGVRSLPVGYIAVGTVEWCEMFLFRGVTKPNYYPDFLSSYLSREVWETKKWPLGEKVFIKPSDMHKRFSGFVTSGSYRGRKKSPYWCSEVVCFVNEWRYYVSGGRVLVGGVVLWS